ncbi:head-tail adaptor protein [Bacillus thuringiensis]
MGLRGEKIEDSIVSVIPTEKHTLSIMWKRGGMNG